MMLVTVLFKKKFQFAWNLPFHLRLQLKLSNPTVLVLLTWHVSLLLLQRLHVLNPFIWERCELPGDLSLFFFLIASGESHCLTPLVSPLICFFRVILHTNFGQQRSRKGKWARNASPHSTHPRVKQVKATSGGCGFWRRSCSPNSLISVSFQVLLGFRVWLPLFYQTTPLRWLNKVKKFYSNTEVEDIYWWVSYRYWRVWLLATL